MDTFIPGPRRHYIQKALVQNFSQNKAFSLLNSAGDVVQKNPARIFSETDFFSDRVERAILRVETPLNQSRKGAPYRNFFHYLSTAPTGPVRADYGPQAMALMLSTLARTQPLARVKHPLFRSAYSVLRESSEGRHLLDSLWTQEQETALKRLERIEAAFRDFEMFERAGLGAYIHCYPEPCLALSDNPVLQITESGIFPGSRADRTPSPGDTLGLPVSATHLLILYWKKMAGVPLESRAFQSQFQNAILQNAYDEILLPENADVYLKQKSLLGEHYHAWVESFSATVIQALQQAHDPQDPAKKGTSPDMALVHPKDPFPVRLLP